MTSSSIDIHRPAYHFTPRRGWMNDPNGLIRVDGQYHAFYQHNPHGIGQGPMHWGHAVSDDLINWRELPVALYPDHLGACFSGSALQLPNGEVKIFYTAHKELPDGSPHEVQCLVHADQNLMNFERDQKHPVLENPGLEHFRDPKVFWHEDTRRWIMLLTHDQCIGIYGSKDLLEWTFESTFGEQEGRHGTGPWECPDLIQLRTPDGKTAWLMVVGLGTDSYGGGSGTQYFIGRFDGYRFINDNPPECELWLDFGRDYYAAQSFSGMGDEPPLTVAWLSNWDYAFSKPTVEFRGALSLPRRLWLVERDSELRVLQKVTQDIAAQFEAHALVPGVIKPHSGTYRLRGSISLDKGESMTLALFGETVPQFTLTKDPDTGENFLAIKRSEQIAGGQKLPNFGSDYRIAIGHANAIFIDIFVDNGLTELCLDDGVIWATTLFFPEQVNGDIVFA